MDKPDTTTEGTLYHHVTKASYDPNSGALLSTDDENSTAHNQASSVLYTYEPVASRPYTAGIAGLTSKTYTYPSTNETDVVSYVSGAATTTTQSITDGYGRPIQTISGGISSERTYDVNGRLYSVTSPHLVSQSGISSTDGTTYMTYDAFDRILSIKEPSDKFLSNTYYGNTTTRTDEEGVETSFTYDAFENLSSVLEGSPATGVIALGSNTFATIYQRDGLGNITCIEQHGDAAGTGCSSPPSADYTSPWRVRRFL